MCPNYPSTRGGGTLQIGESFGGQPDSSLMKPDTSLSTKASSRFQKEPATANLDNSQGQKESSQLKKDTPIWSGKWSKRKRK